jgi:hypothetical protein
VKTALLFKYPAFEFGSRYAAATVVIGWMGIVFMIVALGVTVYAKLR